MKFKVFLSLIIFAFIFACTEESSEVKVVTVEEMERLLEIEDVQLIDVRPQDKNKKNLSVHSQQIDFNSETFEKDIKQLDKKQPVVVYCQKGIRSTKCIKKLQEAGFIKIYDLEGGFSQWIHETLTLD